MLQFTLEQNGVCVILVMVIKTLKSLNVNVWTHSSLPVPEEGEQSLVWCNKAKFHCNVLCIYNKQALDLMGNMMVPSMIIKGQWTLNVNLN